MTCGTKLQNTRKQIVPKTIEKLMKRMAKLVGQIIKKRGGYITFLCKINVIITIYNVIIQYNVIYNI